MNNILVKNKFELKRQLEYIQHLIFLTKLTINNIKERPINIKSPTFEYTGYTELLNNLNNNLNILSNIELDLISKIDEEYVITIDKELNNLIGE